MMHSLRDKIATATFTQGEVKLASGVFANNKIDTDKLIVDENNETLLRDVNKELGRLAAQYIPDYITYVPEGAEPFAFGVAEHLNKPFIRLKKTITIPEQEFFPKTSHDAQQLARAQRLIIVEDVTTTLEPVAGVLDIPEMKGKVAGVVAIWRRGNPEHEVALPVPIHWLVEEYIPLRMSDDEITNFIPINTQETQL